MTIESIQSSWFEAFYNTDNYYLSIVPTKGKVMNYVITPEVWEAFKNSDSKGKFYNNHIKGNF